MGRSVGSFVVKKPEQSTGTPSPHLQGWENDMSTILYFIGIDVSKDQLDIAIRPTNERKQFSNDDDGIDKLIQSFQSLSPSLIVLEATGSYHRLLLSRLVA